MDIYREEILDHYKNPRNYGEMGRFKVKVRETNASCGDMVEIGVRVVDGVIKEIGFEGQGCAISMAAGSMLTEMVKGKKVKGVKEITDEKMVERLGIKISSARKRCATLGRVALAKAIDKYEKEKN